MKKLLVLLVAVCAVAALAENVTLWSCDFETGDGYQADKDLIEQGWGSIWSGVGREMVVNDANEAPSGVNYVKMGDAEEANGANCYFNFDVSGSYQEGCKLLVSWYAKGSPTNNKWHYTKLHNSGTTGKNYDVEIAEFTIQPDGKADLTVSKEDKTGTVGIRKVLSNPTDWHFCQLLIDPKDKTIKEWVIDDEVIFDGSSVYYYKNEGYCTTASLKGMGGKLIDGFRLMNYGAFDGFKVEMVPEPAVFGLIALLGLFFARKQR